MVLEKHPVIENRFYKQENPAENQDNDLSLRRSILFIETNIR
jgi:hypothetical protein